MALTSISTSLVSPRRALSGEPSRSAQPIVRARQSTGESSAEVQLSHLTGAPADAVPQDSGEPRHSAVEGTDFQGSLDEALRQGRASFGGATDATSEPSSARPLPGIAVYQRVSQYGSNDPSSSMLLQRWNSIMQSGKEADATVADLAQALARREAAGHESGVLDLTA